LEPGKKDVAPEVQEEKQKSHHKPDNLIRGGEIRPRRNLSGRNEIGNGTETEVGKREEKKK